MTVVPRARSRLALPSVRDLALDDAALSVIAVQEEAALGQIASERNTAVLGQSAQLLHSLGLDDAHEAVLEVVDVMSLQSGAAVRVLARADQAPASVREGLRAARYACVCPNTVFGKLWMSTGQGEISLFKQKFYWLPAYVLSYVIIFFV